MGAPNTDHLPPEWQKLIAQCDQIPETSAAWDNIEPCVHALQSLAQSKLAQRETGAKIAEFLGNWNDWIERGDLPEECSQWNASAVDPSQSKNILAALDELSGLLSQADALNDRIAEAKGIKNRLELLEQLEQMTAGINEMCQQLAPMLTGQGAPAQRAAQPAAKAAQQPAPAQPAGLDALEDHEWNE